MKINGKYIEGESLVGRKGGVWFLKDYRREERF
jgi:hypothetical protein